MGFGYGCIVLMGSRRRAPEKGGVEELQGGRGVCHWLNCIDGITSCVSLHQVMEDYWKPMPKQGI